MSVRDNYPVPKQGVRLLATAREQLKLEMTAMVQQTAADGGLLLACLDPTKAAQLSVGSAVTIEYFRDGIVYRWYGTIHELRPAADVPDTRSWPVAVISSPTEIKRIQRRRFPRALIALPLSFVRVQPPPGFDSRQAGEPRMVEEWTALLASQGISSYTETVSASGLRFRTESSLLKGDHVFLDLRLPNDSCAILAKVVWLGAGKPREAPGEAVGVEFGFMSERNQENLMQFLAGKAILH